MEKKLQAKHTFIPPGCKNANADVETSHALIKREFYDLEEFRSEEEFLENDYIREKFLGIDRVGQKIPVDVVF